MSDTMHLKLMSTEGRDLSTSYKCFSSICVHHHSILLHLATPHAFHISWPKNFILVVIQILQVLSGRGLPLARLLPLMALKPTLRILERQTITSHQRTSNMEREYSFI